MFSRINKKYLVIPIIITLFIFTQSLLPGDVSGRQSGKIVTFLLEVLSVFRIEISYDILSTIIRKGAHFTEYLILGLSWMFVLFEKDYVKMGVKYALIISFVTASIDETIQLFIPGRSGSIIDVMIDMAGVITGILLLLVFKDRR